MTDRETMSMALELLKELSSDLWMGNRPDKVDRTILALEVALAQPEQWTPVEIGVDVTPEGTHVVGMYVLMPDVVRHVFYSQFHTAPPKREWVGLTDEEIKDILDCGRGGLVDIRKAEQLLKEKNT